MSSEILFGKFVDFTLGTLASAIVAALDRLDRERAAEKDKKREQLRRAAERLRSPSEDAKIQLNKLLRQHASFSDSISKVVDRIGGDPLWVQELVQWLLEPDPRRGEETRRSLASRLASEVGEDAGDLEEFLGELYQGLNKHPELARLRADAKLTQILGSVAELVDLQRTAQRHYFYVEAKLAALLKHDRQQVLVPVRPQHRPYSRSNGLLAGTRPSDEDMDQDVDFRRSKFPEVVRAILGTHQFPAAFIFLADPQRGKTTFLKRVGWELAQRAYSVVQLQAGSRNEPYGRWLIEAASEVEPEPLVVLIDDPLVDREHFQAQMTSLSDRRPRVICLVASRKEDWKRIEVDRVPVLSSAQEFSLDPDGTEGQKAVEKLMQTGLIKVPPEKLEILLEEVQQLPISEGFFHSVLEVASDRRFRSLPDLVEENLAAPADPEAAQAFERLYGYVCLFGIVGIPLPRKAAACLVEEEDARFRAYQFSESKIFPTPPLRKDKDSLSPTHENHAKAFLRQRDTSALLLSVAELSLVHAELRAVLGKLLRMLAARGVPSLATDAWSSVSDHLLTDYWNSCGAESLTYDWGTFFYTQGLFSHAFQVIEVAIHLLSSEKQADRHVLLASALFNKGVALNALGRPKEAIEVYDLLDEQFAGREELALQKKVASALNNKAATLGTLGLYAESSEILDLLAQRFADRDELALQVEIANALFNRGVTLGMLGRSEEAIEVYDRIDLRFGDIEEPAIQEQVASALLNKGVILGKLGRSKQAVEVYDQIEQRFADREEPAIQDQVTKAINNKALVYLTLSSQTKLGSEAR